MLKPSTVVFTKFLSNHLDFKSGDDESAFLGVFCLVSSCLDMNKLFQGVVHKNFIQFVVVFQE